MSRALGERFVAARPGVAGHESALETALAELISRARARYSLSPDDLALVEVLATTAEVDDGDPATGLAQVSDELVFAAACLLGDAGALKQFDAQYAAPLRALVASIAGAAAPDVVQEVWMRLLVARDGRRARLADYGGRGGLFAWLRVITSRDAISTLRRRRDHTLDDDAMAYRLVASQDPALAVIRARSADDVKRAFEQAVATLSVRERNLLRQHLLDGLTIDDLAGLYHVHRATAARWLTSARDAVWKRTQSVLRDRLTLSPAELQSLLGEVRTWIDLSLERVLK